MKVDHYMARRSRLLRWARKLDQWAAALRKREKELRPKRAKKAVGA
jgi:hypothetical protein